MLNPPGQSGSRALWIGTLASRGPLEGPQFSNSSTPPGSALGFLVLPEYPAVSDAAEARTRLLSEAEQPGPNEGAPASNSLGVKKNLQDQSHSNSLPFSKYKHFSFSSSL